MTEKDQPATGRTGAEDLPAPRGPVPDLGFFAGPPPPRDPGAFGGAPPQFGGSAPSQFGGAPSQFGAPAASQFGGTVGTLPPPGPAALAPARGIGPTWKIAAAGAALVLLVGIFFGGRFGWQQFMADPVTPDTLMGMPRVTDASADQLLQGAQDGLADELSSGSAAKVALYSDGQGVGYILFAVRGGSRPGSGGSSPSSGDDPFAGWTESEEDGTRCYSQPAQVAAGLGVTMCIHGFWRRAVFVMGMGLTPPDPAVVARATDEAWDAQ